MANQTTQKVWELDTTGILTTSPVTIEKIVFYPALVTDTAAFHFWSEGEDPEYTKTNSTVTATASTRTFASTGNFATATVDPGDILKITASDSKNVGTYLIATNADNNTITVASAQTVTDDTTKVYGWKTWRPFEFVTLVGSTLTGDLTPIESYFDCYRINNLALTTLSANCRVLVYLS